MTDTIERLRQRKEAAALALNYEEAKRCREKINLIRGGASLAEAEQAGTSGLTRQRPGAMGLGTSRQRIAPPPGWKPPAKPNLLTSGHKAAKRPRRP